MFENWEPWWDSVAVIVVGLPIIILLVRSARKERK